LLEEIMSSVDAGRLAATAPLRRLRATSSISEIQKPERSGHRLRNAWRSGPPSDWCLLTVESADWEDQLHGQKVQDTAMPCHEELCMSVAQFYTECAQELVASEDWPRHLWYDQSTSDEKSAAPFDDDDDDDVRVICRHITISMLWRNTAYCVKLSGEDLSLYSNKKASIRWQDSAPPISGCLSCNNR